MTDSSNPTHPEPEPENQSEPENQTEPVSQTHQDHQTHAAEDTAAQNAEPSTTDESESSRAMASLGPGQNMYGIASIVLGLLGLCFCGPFLAGIGDGATYFLDLPVAIAAVILGRHHVHRVQIGTSTNKSLGFIGIALGVLGVIVAILFGSTHAGTNFHNEVR